MLIQSRMAVAVVVVLAVAGCSKEQRRDFGEIDVRDELHGRVERAVDDKGLDIDGDLDCTADITPEATVTASCNGTTVDGEPVAGTFDGTADVDKDECTVTLIVTIGADEVVNQPDVNCFA